VTSAYKLRVTADDESGGRLYPSVAGAILAQAEDLVGGAVRMGFRCSSRIKGRPPKWLSRACEVRFCDVEREDSRTTLLHLEAPAFGEAAEDIYEQGELFPIHPDAGDTGFDLLGDLLFDVANRVEDSARFDSALLRHLARLDKAVFSRGVNAIELIGHRLPTTLPPKIDPCVITTAKSLSQSTPPPHRARVQGQLDMMRVSDQSFELVLKDRNRVRAVWTGDRFTDMKDQLNQPVLVEGNAVFRPSGSFLRIDAEAVAPSTSADAFFSRLPTPIQKPTNQSKYVKHQTPTTGVGAILGKWPGDETEEELLAALRESD
jgi:hypothetical protein